MSFASARVRSNWTTQLGATGAVGAALVRVGAVDWRLVARLPLKFWGVHWATGIMHMRGVIVITTCISDGVSLRC